MADTNLGERQWACRVIENFKKDCEIFLATDGKKSDPKPDAMVAAY